MSKRLLRIIMMGLVGLIFIAGMMYHSTGDEIHKTLLIVSLAIFFLTFFIFSRCPRCKKLVGVFTPYCKNCGAEVD